MTHQSIHLLLQSSHCIFHCHKVGSHTRANGSVSRDRFQIVTSRHDQQPRTICGFGKTPVTSSSLAPTSTSNESHSFRRASRSFQIRSPTSLTIRSDELRARSRFATHGRDQQRTGNHCAQRAPHHTKEQRNKRLNSAPLPGLLCPARNFRSRSNQTMGCAHAWMSGRAYESSPSMSRLVCMLKTSAVRWQCGWSGTNTQSI